MTGETPATTTSTVEWGSGGGRRLPRLVTSRSRPAALVLVVLGAVAMFGSLVEPWQVLDSEVVFGMGAQEDDLLLGPGRIAGWGPWWIFSISVLAVLAALALLGQRALTIHARTVGLALSAVMLPILVAATANLAEESQLGFFPVDMGTEVGRGLHLAYAAVVLLAAALWLAPTGDAGAGRGRRGSAAGRDRRPDPVDDGPRDLSVEPATPDTLQG